MDPGHAIICCVSLYDTPMTVIRIDIITSSAFFVEPMKRVGMTERREDQTNLLESGAGTEMNVCMVYMCISKLEEHGSCIFVGKTASFA